MAIQSCGNNTQNNSSDSSVESRAFGTSAAMQGINLGNALDSPTPGEWGLTIQPQYFESIKDAGFNAVRIPVRFSAHADNDFPYLIDPDFMLLVDSVVRQGLSNGLIVILDMHHYDEIMLDPASQRDRYLAMWKQLAEYFEGFSSNLYFEILNEPNGQMDAATWNALSADCIQTIRESNPKRRLLAGGVDYNSIDALEQLVLPADKNLTAVVHFYLPFEFTHQGASWVEGSTQWIGTTWDENPAEQQAITTQLDRAAAWSMQNQIPLVMTEFGSISSADAASRQRWTAFLARETEKRNIGWFYWEFCSEFGVYACEQGQWDPDMLEALINP